MYLGLDLFILGIEPLRSLKSRTGCLQISCTFLEQGHRNEHVHLVELLTGLLRLPERWGEVLEGSFAIGGIRCEHHRQVVVRKEGLGVDLDGRLVVLLGLTDLVVALLNDAEVVVNAHFVAENVLDLV